MIDEDYNEFIDLLNTVHAKVAESFINIAKYDYLPRCVWDFDSNFVYVNEDFASCFGYTSSEMSGQPFTKFIYHEDLNKSMDVYTHNTMNEGVTIIRDFSNRYVHKDGSIITVLWLKGFNDFNNRIGSGQIKIIA